LWPTSVPLGLVEVCFVEQEPVLVWRLTLAVEEQHVDVEDGFDY